MLFPRLRKRNCRRRHRLGQRPPTRRTRNQVHRSGTRNSSMGNQYENFLTAIDVGSAKTRVLVAEITGNGLRYRGHGVAESLGSRKGVIVDLEKAVGSIQSAVEQAEDAAGVPVEHCLLGIAVPHIRGLN